MTTIQKESIFQIQRLRALYGESGLDREELAELAIIPITLLEAVECCESLPTIFEGLLRLAAAFQVPVEELVNPTLVRRIRITVARRRAFLERTNERDDAGGCREP